ncbi:GNAT family N-acetyltransferase [Fluviicola sp.]|uniref:GNAT family N-acetyltransferase n=1 Tax=Fluviicola sp. TaxID=1917219 RepID=UPI0026380083|nr:GNAT family N-acetyltransferase [Fluviicola sp.]
MTGISYQFMTQDQVDKLQEIDRSEYIDSTYEVKEGELVYSKADYECENWNAETLAEIKSRFLFELKHAGVALGAFDGNTLVGFGVLAHQHRGKHQDMLQIDLMYVSRNYRRRGIATILLKELSKIAKERGANYLYISSTETKSAVSFYTNNGGKITDVFEQDLFTKEPEDIHMIKKL